MASYFPDLDFAKTHHKLDHQGCPEGDFFKDALHFDKVQELEDEYDRVFWAKMKEMGEYYESMKA